MSGYIGNIPVPQATQTRQTFTATASQTTFNTAGYSPGYIDVFLNGVKLAPADYTATNGSDVVLAVGAASGDILETVAYEIFQVLDQDFTGDFTVDGSTFVVDSTNNRVGIGTSSPEGQLHLYVDSVGAPSADADDLVIEKTGDTGLSILSTTTGRIYFGDAASNDQGSIRYVHSDNSMRFETDSAERMRISNDGSVGIGTSSPSQKLHIEGAGNQFILLNNSTTNDGFYFKAGAGASSIQTNSGSHVMNFFTGGSEAMRIDSSGNLLVGTTNYAPVSNNVVGISARGQYGELQVSTEGSTGAPLYLNRKTSDGDIAVFRKDGTTVGSIGSTSSRLRIMTPDQQAYVFLNYGAADSANRLWLNGSLLPWDNASYDIGSSTTKFKDLYLSGGVYLGGTGSANLLDDYEEGTFSMSFVGSSGNPTYTGGNNLAYYTKIGRLVHFYWYSGSISVSSAGSGTLRITGLPFTVDGNYSPISVAHNTLISGGATTGYFSLNTNYVYLQVDANTTSVISASSLTGGYIMISGTYIAA